MQRNQVLRRQNRAGNKEIFLGKDLHEDITSTTAGRDKQTSLPLILSK